jgi:hypothetical protein
MAGALSSLPRRSGSKPGVRLRQLEAALRPSIQVVISILWADDLTPCREHTGCAVEREAGVHHRSVIRLSWEAHR